MVKNQTVYYITVNAF